MTLAKYGKDYMIRVRSSQREYRAAGSAEETPTQKALHARAKRRQFNFAVEEEIRKELGVLGSPESFQRREAQADER